MWPFQKKALYKVYYKIDCYRTEFCIYVKAKNAVDIRQQLEKRHNRRVYILHVRSI